MFSWVLSNFSIVWFTLESIVFDSIILRITHHLISIQNFRSIWCHLDSAGGQNHCYHSNFGFEQRLFIFQDYGLGHRDDFSSEFPEFSFSFEKYAPHRFRSVIKYRKVDLILGFPLQYFGIFWNFCVSTPRPKIIMIEPKTNITLPTPYQVSIKFRSILVELGLILLMIQ
jgi:hypothetical protein